MKKYLRANHFKFISKELSKEIMLRSKLRNKFLKDKPDEARTKYRKQDNICVHLLRRAKRNYYNNLDLSNVKDNRKFWKTIRPLFANKIKAKKKITLNEDSKSTKDDQKVANIFNSFFVNTAASLKISYNKSLPQNRDVSKLVGHAIKNFENHSSIIAIKNNRNPNDQFPFKPVTKEMIAKEISNLKSGKAVPSNDIPTKIIKDFKDLFATFIYNNYNKCLLDGTFPEDLKTAEVVPVYKKKKRTDKNNYRPVSILSNISKIYERSFYNQMYDYFDSIFSKYQCGFSKGHSPQHCPLYMTEKIKQGRDNNNVFAAVLTNLPKPFDCIKHELLIAKLNAYGFDSLSLKFISGYSNFRKQKTKVSSTFSDYLNILFGARQGSIAGSLFSMFTLVICFSKLILLSSLAMQTIIPLCFCIEPRKTNKIFANHSKWGV